MPGALWRIARGFCESRQERLFESFFLDGLAQDRSFGEALVQPVKSVAGKEDERHMPRAQNFRKRKRKRATEIDVEHRGIECAVLGGAKRLVQVRNRAGDRAADVFEEIANQK